MCRKGFVLPFLIALTTEVCGQAYNFADTVRIGEVTITVRRSSSISSSHRSDTISSDILARQGHKNLGQVLSGYSPVYIKSYGPGGIASVSLRGSSPGHTLVTWNGITVNNSMLGQCDLSLVPAGIADEIRINYGASSMHESSGGIGGSVDLAGKPEWENSTKSELYAGAGSFGHYQAGASIRSGSDRLESSTSFYLDNSENDFPYMNRTYGSDPVRERRANSETEYMGFMQDLFYRNKGSVLSARLWYQDSDRSLPGSLVAGNTYRSEQQEDVSLRSQISYEKSEAKGKISIVAAYINDRLSYSNKQAEIESRNNSSSFFLRGKAEYFPGRATKVTVLLNEEVNRVFSNNYDGIKARNTASLSIAAFHDISERLGASLLVRETFSAGRLLHPDFSGTLRYKASPAQNIFLSTSISRNSRLPAMNDLYWYPGGNPGLQNEYAYQYEAGAELYHTIATSFDLGVDLNCFHNRIHDMIQWLPGSFSYWEPVNIKNTVTTGAELSASLAYENAGVRWTAKADYSFTSAMNMDNDNPSGNAEGYQLVYVPANKAGLLLTATAGKFSAALGNTYTGKRYTTADNSRFLPQFWESMVSITYRKVLTRTECNVNFNIDNLFNTEYQLVAYYPMPGRSFNMRVGFKF